MQIIGKLIKSGEVQSFGNNGFTKKEFVVETDDQYPQKVLIELHKDNTNLLDHLPVGSSLVCHINVRGREWISPKGETKYFNTLVAWRIEGTPLESAPQGVSPQEAFEPVDNLNPEEKDDLPF